MEMVLACESIGTKHNPVMAQFHTKLTHLTQNLKLLGEEVTKDWHNYVWPIPIQLKCKHRKNYMCTYPSVYAYLRKNKKIKDKSNQWKGNK